MSGGYNNVIYLESSDLQNGQVIGVNKPFLIAIVANWCGHCKNLKPTWEQLATEYPMSFLTVEATDKDGEKVAQMLGAKGFPTILCGDASGKITGPHQGGRDRNSLLKSARLQ
jgi:protein disulfide-isomerase A6